MMADTPRLDMPEISENQALKYLTHNSAIRILDAIVQCTPIDKDLTAPPGSPSDGDTYIVGSGATGDWAGQDDDIAYYQSSGWIFITPIEGWHVYVQDEGKFYTFWGASIGWEADEFIDLDDTPVSYSGAAYKILRVNSGADAVEFKEIPFEAAGFKNGTPDAGEVLLRMPMTQSINFPDDMAGSHGVCETGPADSAGVDLSIKKNGVEFAEMSFASGATAATFSTASTDTDFSAGDILTVEAPNPQDGSFADVGFTLKGTIT